MAQPAAKRVYVETYGCQMNQRDTERMLALVRPLSYQPTDDAGEADLVIINTCAIREKAVDKALSAAGRVRRLKEENPRLLVAVAGCAAQMAGPGLLTRLPFVDLVVGTERLPHLPALVAERERTHRRLASTAPAAADLDPFAGHDLERLAYGVTAYVTIQEGCDKFCTFCIVPFVKGRERCRPAEEIVREVECLVARGVREVTLLGQTVNSYGRKGSVTFPELLRRLDAIPGLWRLRFTAPHPIDVTPALVGAMAECATVCEHLHLPAQSGSDRLLRRMNRTYTRAEYLARVAAVQWRIPSLALTTDLIVGFPGETEEDFRETLTLVDEVGYAGAFTFAYSARPLIPARRFGDDVPAGVKAERLHRLQERTDGLHARHRAALVGRTVEVLVEGPSKRDPTLLAGRTRCHCPVHFAGPADRKGTLVTVRVDEALPHAVRGTLVP